MTPERWQRVKELFQTAVEGGANQRAAFLEESCAGDPALRTQVEALIASHEGAPGFLEAPAFEVAPTTLEDDEAALMIGRRIGPYELVREIGHGGMGAVYLAVRADEEYKKQVAIKLVKRGMDTDTILRRFRNERQILANLDHPHIAKLLDGGTTSDGLPYFVMDYVEGLPIDVYCDTHKLPTLERLKLFRTVCSAVHYAHQNHVVHRDLKPSNIFVAADGVPKLLDFGIAKLLNPDFPSQMVESTATLRFMTPDYASPEQVRGEKLAPASDVYSLGVLLYELLTGHRPYRLGSRAPSEVVRIICEEEPEKPSTVISRVEDVSGSDGTLRLTPESVSQTREGHPEKLRRHLAGDLDNIVLMALRKEPNRRYASVEQFSEDVRRHLAGLPVIARKDTLSYRATKFIKRNKASVIMTAFFAMVLVTLLTAGLYLLPRRDRAATAAINSLAVLPLENLSG
ncbi:MAG: serine/threonine protein kinase, partial [Acidobacteria bacterium]|nr:serine/threonine protein kinase [Acidobacteriota bacterium]